MVDMAVREDMEDMVERGKFVNFRSLEDLGGLEGLDRDMVVREDMEDMVGRGKFVKMKNFRSLED